MFILEFYWENRKENGNYYNGLYRDYRVYTVMKIPRFRDWGLGEAPSMLHVNLCLPLLMSDVC